MGREHIYAATKTFTSFTHCGLVQVAEGAVSFSVGNSFDFERFTFQRLHISIRSAFLWEGVGPAPSHSCISVAVPVWLDQAPDPAVSLAAWLSLLARGKGRERW